MFDTTQVDLFAARLNSSPGTVEDEWQDDWSNKVAAEMRSLAPVDTGTLRASIHPDSEGVAVDAPYAVYVEYGTVDTPPQPFALPAVNRLARPAAEDAGSRIIGDL